MTRLIYTRSSGVLWRRTSDQVLVLCKCEFHQLDGIAALVWDAVQCPTSLDEVLAALAIPDDADPVVVRTDVEGLLTRLVSLGAVSTSV